LRISDVYLLKSETNAFARFSQSSNTSAICLLSRKLASCLLDEESDNAFAELYDSGFIDEPEIPADGAPDSRLVLGIGPGPDGGLGATEVCP
jgi:hypothetical protein